VLVGERRARGAGDLRRQILAPRDHRHALQRAPSAAIEAVKRALARVREVGVRDGVL
jgi:hypothetical protein